MSERRKQGIRNLVAGVVLLAIGLFFGGSLFTGDAGYIDLVFDGLGIFWFLLGSYQLITSS